MKMLTFPVGVPISLSPLTRLVMALLLVQQSGFPMAFSNRGAFPNDVARWEPKTLTPLLQHGSRVGSISGSGGAVYFFRSDAAEINELLANYAKVKMNRYEVYLWPSLDEWQTTKGMVLDDPPVRYNVRLDHPDERIRPEATAQLWSGQPRLSLFLDDIEVLNQLEFPEGLVLVHPAQQLMKIPVVLNSNNYFSAILYLKSLGPDAEAFRNVFEEFQDHENSYAADAAKEGLERLKPDIEFRAISDTILRIVAERNPQVVFDHPLLFFQDEARPKE